LRRLTGCTLMLGAFLSTIALSVHAGGQALSAEEISVLVSGKTLEGTNPTMGFEYVTYFTPDGTYRRTKDGNHEQGTWSVTPNDELCMTGGKGTTCRIIKKEGGVWNAYKIRRNLMKLPKHQRRWVRVLDGNPYNL
jgi:hypothetical protein